MLRKNDYKEFLTNLEKNNLFISFALEILGLEKLKLNDYAWRSTEVGFDIFWNYKYISYKFLYKYNKECLKIEENGNYIINYIYVNSCYNLYLKNSNISNLILLGSYIYSKDKNIYSFLTKKIYTLRTT